MAKTLPNSGMVIPEIGDGPADVTKLTDALTTLDSVIGTLKTNISLLNGLRVVVSTDSAGTTDLNRVKNHWTEFPYGLSLFYSAGAPTRSVLVQKQTDTYGGAISVSWQGIRLITNQDGTWNSKDVAIV